MPLEIVSKVLLRHSNLSTTQRYLGKISAAEAIRWIDNLHAGSNLIFAMPKNHLA